MREKKEIPVIFPTGSMMQFDQDGVVADPFGMYTGITGDTVSTPVQDADDL